MFNQSLSMRVIITIDDISHIAVPDHDGTSCSRCSLMEVCDEGKKIENNLSCLCGYFSMGFKGHFELLIPETKSKER